jgi:hypothetical protein
MKEKDVTVERMVRRAVAVESFMVDDCLGFADEDCWDLREGTQEERKDGRLR